MLNETAETLTTEMPGGESRPRDGFLTKLWNVFANPRRTFENIGSGHEWIVLWLIIGAVSLAGYFPIKDIVKDSQMEQVEAQLDKNPSVTPEQRQQILDSMAENFENPAWALLAPVFQLVAMLFVAAVLLFLANIVLGGNTKFLPMLNAYAWTGMLTILGTLVVVPLIMAKGSMDVSLGLGVLASPDTGPFMKKLLTSFELFGLWQVWLSSVAVSVLGKAPAGKSFAAVFVCWFVWVLAQSGLATIGVNFGM
jgi:hypothetical protein